MSKELDNICEECNEEDDSVSQNLIMHYKMLKFLLIVIKKYLTMKLSLFTMIVIK